MKRGFCVALYEMRPTKTTPAHKTDGLCELVCSNSLKSLDETTASGLLKRELEILDSMVLKAAQTCRVQAGGALAVDREKFSQAVERELKKFENFSLIRGEVQKIDEAPTIVATGPLTSDALTAHLAERFGQDNLFFYDAVAPIVSADSVDMNLAFWGGRYGKGGDDYLNLPMNKEQYLEFYNALISAECVKLHDFEGKEVFEGCMPIEVMAKRGEDAIRFGPLRPVGLSDKEGRRYYAVVQLRRENIAGDAFNMVGFQTNLTFPEQRRVFSMIPALHSPNILRYGVMHKNTFINSPKILDASFRVRQSQNPLYLAGQMTGVEGYVECIASGLLAGINLSRELAGKEAEVAPQTTICGGLSRWISSECKNYQPMNANFGLLPQIVQNGKTERKKEYSKRAINDILIFGKKLGL